MLLSRKSLVTVFRVWFVGCAYLSRCTCAPISTNDAAAPASSLQLADLKTPDQASGLPELELASGAVSLIPDTSVVPSEIDIDVYASASSPGRGGVETPPYDDNDMPGWLVMYIEYITWVWGIVTAIVSWIVNNVLPVILFGAACVVTGGVVVVIAWLLVAVPRAIAAGPQPTERTPLYRSQY